MVSQTARSVFSPVLPTSVPQSQAARAVEAQIRRPIDTFAAPKLAPAATRPADGLKAYDELTSAQKSLLGDAGATGWDSLSTKERGVFLTLTQRLAANGIDLTGMKLRDGLEGIHGTSTRFELIFDKASTENLKAQIAAQPSRFTADKVSEFFHKEFSESGFRENRSKYSMQLGFGEGGAFVDMDRYNPLTSKLNWLKHWGEILTPGNMDPVKISKDLGTELYSRLP